MIDDRFSDEPAYEPARRPAPAEYMEDGVGAIPAGVFMRCNTCRVAFALRVEHPVTCPACGAVLERL